MPTLFERLDTSLAGSDLSVKVSLQAGNLSSVTTTVAGLTTSPPPGVADLQRALNELPLPDLKVSGSFGATLGSLQVALPTDLSSVTGALTSGLRQLQVQLNAELTGVLKDTLEIVAAFHLLTQIDFTCEGKATASGGVAGGATATIGGEPPSAAGADGGSTTGDTQTGSTESAGTLTSTLDKAEALFSSLPSPLNVETFLEWLHKLCSIRRRGVSQFPLPFIDDVCDSLETLVAWKAMSPAEIRENLAATLKDMDVFVGSGVNATLVKLSADLSDIVARSGANVLAQIADGLTAKLVELRAALTLGNLTGKGPAIAAINGLLDQYTALRSGFETDVTVLLPPLGTRLKNLPDDLEDQITHVISILRPSSPLGLLDKAPIVPGPAADIEELADFEKWVNTATEWVQGLLSKLDFASLQEPIAKVATEARAAVETLDKEMVKVTLEVQKLFGEVETLVGQVDTEALAAEVEAAIEKFQTELTQQLNALFAPVREIVSQVIASIETGLDAFDPDAVVGSLRDVIQSLVGVLEDPAVTSALEEIRNAVDTAAKQIESLSFAPLTDQVIALIEEIGDSIESIDTSQLNAALQVALQAALAVLPEDLTPVTDPLIGEFGSLTQAGPVSLIATLQLNPQQLLEKVRVFEPAVLIGEALSKPYEDLLTQMEAFSPRKLLEPVDAELAKLKERLRAGANPGLAIRPMEQPFADLMRAFDDLSPDKLVKPLEEQLTGIIDEILSASPLDEILEQTGLVVRKSEEVVTVVVRLAALIKKLRDALAVAADSKVQAESWMNSILAKIESMPNAALLEPFFAKLSVSLDSTKAVALSVQFNAAVDSSIATLTTLDGQTRLTALIQAYRAVSGEALAALPDSPEKADLAAALGRFNPMQPGFGAPYQQLEEHRQILAGTKAAMEATLASWDSRYHRPGGTLACFHLSSVTPAQLRAWIREVVEPQLLRPVTRLFTLLEPLGRAFGGMIAPIQRLTSDLQQKLGNLLTGPDSLGGIHGALEQLVQQLRGFDLGFLRKSLGELHAQVRGKLDVVNPARLRELIEKTFDDALGTLDVGQVISPADLLKLDAEYAKVVAKLKTLHPGELVVKLVQPEFELKVIPILASFDLSKLLEAVFERLRGLEAELKQEMSRINDAYRALRGSMPSLNVSIDIDVGISF